MLVKVKQIMTTDVSTVTPNDTITKAASIMNQLNVGSVPVIDGNRVVGIVTDRDITLRGVAKSGNPNQKISEVMTTDVKYATPDMDVHAVADLMAENQVRRLPVIDNDKLVGIVAIGDLAVENIFENEAGEALHNISMGVRH
ncbi:MAG TPA: CBS domain-containing protein [Bacillota bacterium]|jgi:CBS domain-containing protein|nr:CBS domain-containing protein [Bacillota bacterium]HQE65324.1 CBS domain-containing protein [Bacillota bacterium]HQI15468.1 CBS domain-containing protein [Bacillota bacterium]HQJ37006.1 CBS domain-containing protein [Bacillota bacterium]HQL36185.1 CBS domain-containing protein [Bacillota bacterium]